MFQRRATVRSACGLHARPAALFSKAVADSGVRVTIARDGGVPVDAASLLLVMGLGVGHGDEVLLAAEGPGASAALDSLAGLLEQDLDSH